MTINTQRAGNTESPLSDLSSNAESVTSGSTKAPKHPKPLSRAANAKAGPSSKPQKQSDEEGNQQPAVAELKKLGIKVRDFAYESTLPPLPTIYRHPRQIQPGVARPLQRQVTEPDQNDSQPSQPNRAVERTPTEPSLTPTPPVRMRGYFNLEEFDLTDDGDIFDSQQPNTVPEQSINTQISPAALESQNLEAGAFTSLIPQESSLSRNTRNASRIPASRLDEESKVIMPESLSYSHLGLSQPVENPGHTGTPSNSQPNALSAQPSPLTPLPSSPHTDSLSQPSQSQHSGSFNSRSNSTQDLPVIPRVITPRYHLRKRTAPTVPHSPPRPPKRARKFVPAEAPTQLTRPHPVSAQSSHSPTKNRDNSGSSSSRSLRQRPATTTGKGKRKRA